MGTIHLQGDRPLEPGRIEDDHARVILDGDLWPGSGAIRGSNAEPVGLSAYPLVTVWPADQIGLDPDGTPVVKHPAPIFEGRAGVQIKDRIQSVRQRGEATKVERRRVREYEIEFPYAGALPAEVTVKIVDMFRETLTFRFTVIDANGVRATLHGERAL